MNNLVVSIGEPYRLSYSLLVTPIFINLYTSNLTNLFKLLDDLPGCRVELILSTTHDMSSNKHCNQVLAQPAICPLPEINNQVSAQPTICPHNQVLTQSSPLFFVFGPNHSGKPFVYWSIHLDSNLYNNTTLLKDTAESRGLTYHLLVSEPALAISHSYASCKLFFITAS